MISNDAFENLLKRSRRYICDWLTEGIVRYYAEGDPDGFYPHSFVSIDGDPVFTLIRNYQQAYPLRQTVLREAIAGLSALALPNITCRRVALLEDARRLSLLSIISSLVSETACADAIPRLTDSVTNQADGWKEGVRKNAFATVLRCITDLALSSANHISFNNKAKITLESCLVRLIRSEQFLPAYAPRCAHALVTLDPESFFQSYRELIGEQILLLHKLDKEQETHAYATVDIIAERCAHQLMKYSPELKFDGLHPFDKWILDALNRNEKKSRYMLIRQGNESNQILIVPRIRNSKEVKHCKPISLYNQSLHRYQLMGDIPALDESTPLMNGVLASAKSGMNNLLRKQGT